MEYRFLLVWPNIAAVLGETTIYRRRKKLEKMIQGDGLEDAYSAALERLLLRDMKMLSNYYLTGKMLTPIARMRIIEHHSCLLLSIDMKGLSSYY